MFRIFVVMMVFLLLTTAAGAADFSGYLQAGGQVEDKKFNFVLRKLSLRLSDELVELETDLSEDFRLIHGNLTVEEWGQKFSFGRFLGPVGFQFPPANRLTTLNYPKASAYPFDLGVRLVGNIQSLTYRFAITEAETAKNLSGRLTYKQQVSFLTCSLSGMVKIGKEKEFARRIYGGDANLQTKAFSFFGGYNYLKEKVTKKAWWLLVAVPVDGRLTLFSQLQGWQTGAEDEINLTVGVNFSLQKNLMLRHNLIFPVRTKKTPTRVLLALQQEF